MIADELTATVGQEAGNEMRNALSRIQHCLNQLSDEQAWWRSHPAMNSIGNLILHLCGNVRQWLVSGLGGVPDTRNRPAEFSERGPISKVELLRRLKTIVEEARAVLGQQKAEPLLEVRRIQGSEVSGLNALFHSVAHFRGHTQEIVYMTRLLLGADSGRRILSARKHATAVNLPWRKGHLRKHPGPLREVRPLPLALVYLVPATAEDVRR